MGRVQANLAWDTLLDLGDGSGGPLHQRLADALRDAIRAGRLDAGAALPPSRMLAGELGCSRWVVMEAYEQLAAEGYLDARVGSGTRVRAMPGNQEPGVAPATTERVAAAAFDLTPGLPDLAAFPRAAWITALRTAISAMSTHDLDERPAEGHLVLRQVLARYLARVRGAATDVATLNITSGITDGISRSCVALRAAGRRAVAVEEPCWERLRRVVRGAGLDAIPITVDESGVRVEDLTNTHDVRAVIVSPCHQYPTGVALSSERRAALLDWVRAIDGVVLEDDYDSEFRYDRPATAVMQAADRARVFLFGSLSKTMSPGLSLGWAVVPPQWAGPFADTRVAAHGPSTIDQLAFASMLENGDYDRHLRRMRRLYRGRRQLLLDLVATLLPGMKVSGTAAGLHLVIHPEAGCDIGQLPTRAHRAGASLSTLSMFRSPGHEADDAIVIGYGNIADDELAEALRVVAGLLASLQN